MHNEIIKLTTDDNHIIAIQKISQTDNIDKVCFLTHGTFSDKRICLGLANFLAKYGYACYILEWRNHGDSNKTTQPFDFETIALYDIKATFDYLCYKLDIQNIHAITHSGGGISLAIFLSRYPKFCSYVQTMTLVACQAFGASYHYLAHLRLLLFKYLTKMIGFIPARLLKLGVVDENYHTMKLWFDWNLGKNFYSRLDDTDYKILIKNISVPVYCICAYNDKIIAPSVGCYQFFKLFTHHNNQFEEFSIKNGHLDNYTHARIMLSKNSSKEVWVKILAWIRQCENNFLQC